MIFTASLRGVREQRHRARPLDRMRQLALVPGTAPRDPPGDDLASLGHEALQAPEVLVVDEVDLLGTELTDLSPAEPAALRGACSCWGNCRVLLKGNLQTRTG